MSERSWTGPTAVDDATSDGQNLDYDVAVIGGGNAALCAAIAARRAGARVVVFERAPRDFRGGNSRHTRNFRCVHPAPDQYLTGTYDEDEFWSDLRSVNGGAADETLARLAIRDSATCPDWMAREGARFQAALHGTLQLGRTNLFFLGGGKALMNSYYASAERLGIDVLYDADVVDLHLAGSRFESVSGAGRRAHESRARRVGRIASGGFEANLNWLREVWGEAADNFIVRGTPYNTGVPLKRMLEAGAQPVGEARECHAIAVDARAPKFDGGIVTRLDCLPLGIVVNCAGAALLRRGRGHLAEAIRDLGQAHRTAARPDRLLDRRCQERRRVHAVGVPAGRCELDRGVGRLAAGCRRPLSRRPSMRSTARCGRAR